MTLEEANRLAIELDITDTEFGDFFLTKQLQNATNNATRYKIKEGDGQVGLHKNIKKAYRNIC